MIIPRVTPPQKRLLRALEQPQADGWARYIPRQHIRGDGLVSAWALWRRGYVATNPDTNGPSAFARRRDGWVQLTPLGIELRAAMQKEAN